MSKTTRQLAKDLIVRSSDTSSGGGHTSVPSALGKTWAFLFKKANRPVKKVEKDAKK